MQQLSTFTLLGPSAANGSSSNLRENGGVTLGSGLTSPSMRSAGGGEFTRVFNGLSQGESLVNVEGEMLGWEQLSRQYPQLFEQLGEGFDFSEFLSQIKIDGQNLTSVLNDVGEGLPLSGDQGSIDGLMQDLVTWFNDLGVELGLDENGHIVPIDISMEEGAFDPVAAQSAIANIASVFRQLSGNTESSGDKAAVDASGVSPINALSTGPSAMSAAGSQKMTAAAMTQGAAPVVTVTTTPAVESGTTNASAMAQTLSETSLQKTAMDQGMQQGFSQQGQSEADAQAKAFFDAALNIDNSDEAVDELMVTKTVDSATSKFSEIQSKIQGAGLKQYSTGVNVPVGDPNWTDQMSQKIVWMTGRQIQSAEIHLNPAELGPVEVKISVTNEQAAISFNVQHASVRELLESNVQRLREMMDANGVELADVNVGGGEQESEHANPEQEAGQDSMMAGESGDEVDRQEERSVVESAPGLVDYYA